MASYKYKFLGRGNLPPRMTEAEAEELCGLLPEQIAQIPKDENVDDEVRARDAAARAELFSFAEEWLHEKKVVLPGVTTLEDLALQTVHAAIKPARLRAILKHVFEEGQDPGTTVLEWLKRN